MKKMILLVIGFALLFGACEMPGAGEIASEVQGQVDDISDEIQGVIEDNEDLSERIDVLQEQIASGSIDMPDMPDFDFDIDGLLETFDEDFETLSARSDSLMDEMTELIDIQALSIDSLRSEITDLVDDINDLEGEIASVRNSVTALGANSGDSGRTGSSTGGTGRSGSTGGTTGGSTGGRM